jgi:hypothetical protein
MCVAFWCSFEVVGVVLEFNCMHRLCFCLSQLGRGEENRQKQDRTYLVVVRYAFCLLPSAHGTILRQLMSYEVIRDFE